MTGWSAEDLTTMGDATEIDIASTRADGSLRPYVTIWAVRHGDDLYVRSAQGYENPWFQRALAAASPGSPCSGRLRGVPGTRATGVNSNDRH